MIFRKEYLTLYAVTNRVHAVRESLYDQVKAALSGGVTCVQLREKYMDDDRLLEEAVFLKDTAPTEIYPLLVVGSVRGV